MLVMGERNQVGDSRKDTTLHGLLSLSEKRRRVHSAD
jgi:hypothetical protein